MLNRCVKKVKAIGVLKVVLFSLATMLFIAALTMFLVIYLEGEQASKNAQELLAEYEQIQIVSKPTPSSVPSETLPAVTHTFAPTRSPQILENEFKGYEIIGKLEIEKIDVVLPVIAQMSTKSLKVSICHYKGELPTQPGNLIITGHNYSSGAHFGRLDEVEAGDVLVLTSPDHTEYHYEVYKTLIIKPDQAKILDEVSYEYELTLFTCSRRGNQRFVVRARLIED